MSKIFTSFLIITIVCAIAITTTRSFFSDVEISRGNHFRAGAVDLTVDSEGHYNGYECVDDKWQTCVDAPDQAPMFTEGFESPVVGTPQLWNIFDSPVNGWTVSWETGQPTTFDVATQPATAKLELHRGVLGNAYAGQQYAELDTDWDGPSGSLNGEPALVRISKSVATENGKTYQLKFYFSARPNTGSSDNELKVKINGTEYSYTEDGTGDAQPVWTPYTKDFTATEATTIEFAAGGTANAEGVFLDEISVTELVQDCTPATDIPLDCHSTWDLTDLRAEHKFFDFSDLKPGDYGENTISLHVENNPAYACAYTTNMTDLEVPPPVNSETVDGDLTTNPGEDGEMAEVVNFFAWRDDGDNIWEDGEESLFNPVAPVPATTFLNGWSQVLFGPSPTPIPTGTTVYLGVAWCMGTMTVNTVDHTTTCDGSTVDNKPQTDAINADIGFYVEQARHNKAFTCKVPNH